MNPPEIRVLPDLKALVDEAASRIADQARAAIAEHGAFSIALSGGSTPKPVYERLTIKPLRSRIDWSKVHVYFGDERTVPPTSDQSNFQMAQQALLARVPIPASQIYRMKGELDPEQAAIEYGKLLKDQFGENGLDLILLGMGPDGHTASLFPETAALQETKHRCVANFVPKLNTWRITMTAPFINRAKSVCFLVSGADKADRLKEVLQGPRDPQRLPSQLISPTSGCVAWLIDAPAAGK